MKKIFLFALSLLASAGLFAQVQVTADKSGTELQAAIDAAEAGTTVYVQAGTYFGNFTMKEGVNVSGGWNEGFTAQTDYATILDAKANGRVLHQAAAFTTLTVWSNLTIQNGKFTAQQTDKAGSGVFLCDKGQVKHCLIQNNLFDATSGEASGGGVYENGYTTSVLVDDCIIRGNTASHGGGVRICGVIQNSIIENNTTTINACGGVQLHYGGAMYNCIVRGNTGKDTGGVRLTGTKACTVANCLIVGNTATGTIGGVSVEGGLQNIYNCTIVGNNQKSTNSTGRCGVRINVNADAPFYNNIVCGNMANGEIQAAQLELHATYQSERAARVFKNNAIVFGSEVGVNTILLAKEADPGFVDASHSDFHLLYTSALINKGDDSQAKGETDLDGKARKAGPAVDLGCYELPYYKLTIAAFEHATLTAGTDPLTAGAYELPQGYTTTATIVADEGYSIKSVKLGDATLEPVEGIYTLPALTADVTLTITVEQIVVNLTIAAFEHATLTVEGVGVTVAGTYPVPYGYTTTATLVADEGYSIKSVKLGEDELVPVEGVYTIPALKADVTITITVEKDEVTAIINGQQQAVSRKVLRDGQLLIIRNEATFNAQGQVVK